jgi:hypothetical protein
MEFIMLFQPQINYLTNINKSDKLKFITRKSYGFCVFFKVLENQYIKSELGFTDIHNSLVGERPTLQSLTLYVKNSSQLYAINASTIKKNKKVITVRNEAREEFKNVYNIYYCQMKLHEKHISDFLKS